MLSKKTALFEKQNRNSFLNETAFETVQQWLILPKGAPFNNKN